MAINKKTERIKMISKETKAIYWAALNSRGIKFASLINYINYYLLL
jgi:hypothetical protein